MALNNQHAAAARLRVCSNFYWLITRLIYIYIFSSFIIKASAMASSDVHHTSASNKLVRSQPLSSVQHPIEQQMTNDASHHHQRTHVPWHQPDVTEHKENDDRLTTTSVFPLSSHQCDERDDIENKTHEKRCSISQITSIEKDERTSGSEKLQESPTSSSSPSNRIKTTTDVQTNNNEVSLLNHNICSQTTITDMHSVSSDGSSSTRRFIPSAVDQQSGVYGNDHSLPIFPSSTTSISSSSLMHEQANHANDKYLENPLQISSSPQRNPIELNKGLLLLLT